MARKQGQICTRSKHLARPYLPGTRPANGNARVPKPNQVVSRFFRTFQRQRKSEGWSVLGLALDMTP